MSMRGGKYEKVCNENENRILNVYEQSKIYSSMIIKYFHILNLERNRCSEIILDQENAGVEEILAAARRIMIDKKVIYKQLHL